MIFEKEYVHSLIGGLGGAFAVPLGGSLGASLETTGEKPPEPHFGHFLFGNPSIKSIGPIGTSSPTAHKP